jgi:hypothetical protein
LYHVIRAIVNVLVNLFIRREYVGLENFPEPPYIVAINHLSVFDTPVLLTVCPHTIRALTAAKHKRNPIYAPLLVIMGSIWVRRGEVDRRALREALDVLKRIKDNLPRLRRTYVRAVVGEPFRLPENGRVRGQKLHEYTDLIMHRIAELLPEEYRGVYA